MSNEKWTRPSAPPPPLFTGVPEKNFQKQISDEVTEDIIGQHILYFPIDVEKTNFHPLYKEAIHKVFQNPIRVYCMIKYEDNNTVIDNFTIDRRSSIVVHFAKRRITEDQDLFVREGDLLFYNDEFHEIATLAEPTMLYGDIKTKVEVVATCVKCRSAPIVSNRG